MNKQAAVDYIRSRENQYRSKTAFWFGFTLFFISLISLAGCYRYHVVERDGVLVNMKVVKHFIRSGKGAYYSSDFFYNGEVFSEKTNKYFIDNHPVGDLVTMKYVPGISVVLFPDENTDWMFQFGGVIAFIGLGFMVYYFRPNK